MESNRLWMKTSISFTYDKGKKVPSVWSLFDTVSEVRVYDQVVAMADPEDYTFTANKMNREKICERTGLSDITVRHIIAEICKKEVIIRLDRGFYRLNPKFLGINDKRFINK